jgi:hypothetical protein
MNIAPESTVERPTIKTPPTVIRAPAAREAEPRAPAAHDSSESTAEPEPARRVAKVAKPSVAATKKPQAQESAGRQKRGTQVEELTLLDRARRAVVSGDNKGALAGIDRHKRLFPKSQLGEEREALRVRALKGAGLARQAGRAASEFESRYPNSVLAPQMNDGKRSSR